MYVPDEARPRLRHLSSTAIELYLYHCQWRDHKTGYSRKSRERAASELGLSRTTAYRAYKKLFEEDFLSETADGRIGLRGGSFEPYDKSGDARAVWSAPPLKAAPKVPENGRLNFEPEGCGNPCGNLNFETEDCFKSETDSCFNIETENSNIETNCFNIETAHIKDRARGLSINPSINLSISAPSDTHTLESQPAREEAPAARVCVLAYNRLTRHADEAVEAYALANGLGRGWMTEARRTGEWDGDVDKFLAEQKPLEAVAESGGADGLMSFREAAQHVYSFIQAGHDPLKAIGYVKVSEKTHAQLVERFCNSPPGQTSQAAGGS